MALRFVIFITIFLKFYIALNQIIHQKILVDSFTVKINQETIFRFVHQNKLYLPSIHENQLVICDLQNPTIKNQSIPQEFFQSDFNVLNDSILILRKNKKITLYNLNSNFILKEYTTKKNYIFVVSSGYRVHNEIYLILAQNHRKSYILYLYKISQNHIKKLKKIHMDRIYPIYTDILANCNSFSLLSDSTFIFSHCLYPLSFVYKIKNKSAILYHTILNPNYSNEKIRPESYIQYPCLGKIPQAHSNFVYSPFQIDSNYFYQFSYFPTSSSTHLEMLTNENVEQYLPGIIEFWDKDFKNLGKIITTNSFLHLEKNYLYEYKQVNSQYTIYKYKIDWKPDNYH